MDLTQEIWARRQALIYGAQTLEQLRDWADARILSENVPDARLFDISIAASRARALTAMAAFDLPASTEEAVRLVFALFRDALAERNCGVGFLAKGLFELALNGHGPDAQVEDRMMRFDTDLALARQNIWGSEDEIELDMLEFLERQSRL